MVARRPDTASTHRRSWTTTNQSQSISLSRLISANPLPPGRGPGRPAIDHRPRARADSAAGVQRRRRVQSSAQTTLSALVQTRRPVAARRARRRPLVVVAAGAHYRQQWANYSPGRAATLSGATCVRPGALSGADDGQWPRNFNTFMHAKACAAGGGVAAQNGPGNRDLPPAKRNCYPGGRVPPAWSAPAPHYKGEPPGASRLTVSRAHASDSRRSRSPAASRPALGRALVRAPAELVAQHWPRPRLAGGKFYLVAVVVVLQVWPAEAGERSPTRRAPVRRVGSRLERDRPRQQVETRRSFEPTRSVAAASRPPARLPPTSGRGGVLRRLPIGVVVVLDDGGPQQVRPAHLLYVITQTGTPNELAAPFAASFKIPLAAATVAGASA
jgi:hypothetical protein